MTQALRTSEWKQQNRIKLQSSMTVNHSKP